MLLEEPDAAIDVLEALRALGTQIYLDDFGTGYSSFRYLHRFPVQAVKLDRSFVRGVEADVRNSAIVHTMITIAETLGLDVVAEGVETAAELSLLQGAGCPLGQGFLFSRPLPASDVRAAIRAEPGVRWTG